LCTARALRQNLRGAQWQAGAASWTRRDDDERSNRGSGPGIWSARAGGRRPSVCVCVPVRRQASGVSQSLALPLTALVGSLAPRLPKAGQRHGPGGRRGLVRAGSTVPACWWPACHWPANLSGNAARRRDRRDTLSAATTVKSLDRPHPCQPKIFEMAGRSRSGCGWVIKGSRGGGVVDEEEGQPLAGLRRRKGGRVSGRESPRAARR
jgi:hypothetical protein